MTAYSAITSGQVDAESYIDTVLTGQWTDNVLAIQENDASAPALIGVNPITTAVISNDATIDFTSGIDGTYVQYVFIFESVVCIPDGVDLLCRVSVASAFKAGASDYQYVATGNRASGDGTSASTAAGDTTASSILLTAGITNYRVGTSTGEGLSGELRLYNPQSTSLFCKVQGNFVYDNKTSQIHTITAAGRYNVAASAVDGIRFYFSSGNLESGTIRMYGVRK